MFQTPSIREKRLAQSKDKLVNPKKLIHQNTKQSDEFFISGQNKRPAPVLDSDSEESSGSYTPRISMTKKKGKKQKQDE